MPICWPNEVRNMYGLPSVVSSAASPPTNCGISAFFTMSSVTLTLPERIGPKIMYGSPSIAFCICARATPGLVCVSYKVRSSFCFSTPPLALISSTARITPSRKLPPDGASGPEISPTYATLTCANATPHTSIAKSANTHLTGFMDPSSAETLSRAGEAAEPSDHLLGHLRLATEIEVIALRHHLDRARAATAALELLRRIQIARLLVATQVEDGTTDARRELKDIRAVRQIEEARGARHVPPAAQQHQLPALARGDQFLGLGGELRESIAGEQAGFACERHHVLAAAVRREQHQRRRVRMIGDVLHREHAAIAVADHHRSRQSAPCEPGGGEAVVLHGLRNKLEGGAFGLTRVADGEDVVATAVEGERCKAQFCEHWRQEARRAAVEVHRVAVKQQRCAGARPSLGLVPCAFERHRIGRNGDE